MGLNAFFTYTVCFTMGYTWQQALAIVLISGVIFLVVSVSPLRSKLIGAIPACLKSAISAGIGLFICLIGMLNVGLIVATGDGVSAGAYTGWQPGQQAGSAGFAWFDYHRCPAGFQV